MFTGIIQSIGRMSAIEPHGGDTRARIDAAALDLARVQIGDSVAVAGVCLTVVEISGNQFSADVSQETLARTTLGRRRPGDAVNLELALTLSTPLGGHLVSGHVDGVGLVQERSPQGRSQRLLIEAPADLARYIAAKGSICVDGVSLTVNAVEGARFEINIVPHTLAHTTLSSLDAGAEVNLEVDLVARYLERLLDKGTPARRDTNITREFLELHGFLK